MSKQVYRVFYNKENFEKKLVNLTERCINASQGGLCMLSSGTKYNFIKAVNVLAGGGFITDFRAILVNLLKLVYAMLYPNEPKFLFNLYTTPFVSGPNPWAQAFLYKKDKPRLSKLFYILNQDLKQKIDSTINSGTPSRDIRALIENFFPAEPENIILSHLAVFEQLGTHNFLREYIKIIHNFLDNCKDFDFPSDKIKLCLNDLKNISGTKILMYDPATSDTDFPAADNIILFLEA